MSLVALDVREEIPMDEVDGLEVPAPKRTTKAKPQGASAAQTCCVADGSGKAHPAGRRKSKRRFIEERRENAEERRTPRDARLFSCSGIRRGSRRRLR